MKNKTRNVLAWIMMIFLFTAVSSVQDYNEYKIKLVNDYLNTMDICSTNYRASKEGYIKENIGDSEYTIIEEGVFILDDGNVKAVCVYMNKENREVWLLEVYYSKSGELLITKTKNRGVKLD